MAKEASSMVVDYVVFVALVFGCALISVWDKIRGNKHQTKADFVFARSGISAMLLSFARGSLGVRSFLGYPSELFYNGAAVWETLYGYVLAFPVAALVFVPVYYNLHITSVYQYLDMRFKSRVVRFLASGTYMVRSALNLGVTVFTPCVALKTVIGVPYWLSIVSICSLGCFFTVVGGFKAAITADVVQSLFMIGILVVLTGQGTNEAGGIANVVNTNWERGRLKFFNFDMDPTIRMTTVSAFIGQFFMQVSILGCQQNFVQRYSSMKTEGEVVKTLLLSVPVISILFNLCWVAGMAIFATYAECDPLTIGYTSKIDEIVPFFVEDKFSYLPGMLGIFMASLFNGSFNMLLSNLNSMATVTYEDFVSHLPCFKNASDKEQLNSIKVLGVLLCILVMGIAFGVSNFTGVMEASLMVTSATTGPLLGVFLLALLFPSVNWKGATVGMVVSHALTLWITFGSVTVTKTKEYLDLSIAGCTNDTFSSHLLPHISELLLARENQTLAATFFSEMSSTIEPALSTITTYEDVPVRDFLKSVYSITYMYYAVIGTSFTILVGVIVSCITGTSDEDIYDDHLIYKPALKISKWLPGKPRKYLNSPPAKANGDIDHSVKISTIEGDIKKVAV